MGVFSLFDLVAIGLWLITLSLVLQLAFSWRGNREMRIEFLFLYTLGVALLAYNEYVQTNGVSYNQLIASAVALLLLLRFLSFPRNPRPLKARR